MYFTIVLHMLQQGHPMLEYEGVVWVFDSSKK
jgi:hypothetical protein